MIFDEEARVLLDSGYKEVTAEHLHDGGCYVSCQAGVAMGCLDSYFTAKQLRAIAEWMDHPKAVAEAYARIKELS